jgi:hypothetical protein
MVMTDDVLAQSLHHEQVKQLKISIMRGKFELFQRFRQMSLVLKLLNLFQFPHCICFNSLI